MGRVEALGFRAHRVSFGLRAQNVVKELVL